MDSNDARDTGTDAAADSRELTFLHMQVPEPGTLPRGQHDLPPEYVADHQRIRIQDATTHVLAERGYGTATIGDIVARAHVSRRTFYDHFESKEHCVLATFGAATECIAAAVRTAYSSEDEWDAAIAAGLSELVRVLIEYPRVACTCFLEVRALGTAAADQTSAVRSMCIDALRTGAADRPGAEPVSDMAFEMGLGGLLTVIRARLAAHELESLPAELPDIARALLEPLAGRAAADAVARRVVVASDGRSAHAI